MLLEVKKVAADYKRKITDICAPVLEVSHNVFADKRYGDVGFFITKNPKTKKYKYSNWGSREWEYYYMEEKLKEMCIDGKVIIDIGIGRPVDCDFYKFYVSENCYMTAFDPDVRMPKVTNLSKRCKILRMSAEKLPLKNESVDVAVVLSSFEHFPLNEFSKTIKELFRVLKPGGDLLVTLDLTLDHQKSARWAILEKTMNHLSKIENDQKISKKGKFLTIDSFLGMIRPYFKPKSSTILNFDVKPKDMVYSPDFNSNVAYLHLYKQDGRPPKSR